MITELEKIDFILKEGARKGMVLTQFVNTQIKEFKESNKYKEMVIGNKYYKNEGDINKKERKFINENGMEEVAPHAKNYKLKHPIIYKMINQKAGYLLRKKPTIQQVVEKGEKEDTQYKNLIKSIYNNKMHKRLKYTLIESVKRGIAWWQIYIDSAGMLKVRLRYATRIIPIWKDEEHEVLDALILLYDVEVYTNENNKEIKTKVEYYDEAGIRYYIYNGNNLMEDVEEVEKRKEFVISKDTEGTSILGHYKINGQTRNFEKRIPFIYFKYNGDEIPLIHLLKSLLDCYDEMTSKMGDTIYEEPDGVNVVKNYQAEAGTFQKNLQTFNTVFLDDDGEYDRKSISISIEAFKEFITQLRKDIYEGGSGVDTQSEKFGTQESGVALKQLYSDLYLDCSNIETEFKSSLEFFMSFVTEWIAATKTTDYSNYEADFIFNKTMTVNEKELIENCKNSVEIISKRSVLANHPYVSNVDDELDRIKNEEEEKKKEEESEYEKALKQLKKNKLDNSDNIKVGDNND